MANKYWKQQQYNVIFSNEDVETPVCRAAWPSLVTKKAGTNPDGSAQEPKFSVTLLIPKDNKRTQPFLDAVNAQVAEMLPIYNESAKGAKLGSVDIVKDGDAYDLEKYPNFKGNWVIAPNNSKDVRVVDGSAEPKDIDKSLIVGGVKVKCLVAPKLHSKGVSYTLKIVQLVKDDGVRFGGGVRDLTKMLSAVEDDEDEAGSLQTVVPQEEKKVVEKTAPIAAKKGMSSKMQAAISKL